jgi:hypothetical protein
MLVCDLSGKVALVTGGSSGVGKASCYQLAARDCHEKIKLFLIMDDHHTVKTSLNKVFTGSETHMERIVALVIHMNRLVVNATHFIKFYILTCPLDQQQIFGQENFKEILKLINNTKFSIMQKETKPYKLRQHYQPFIIEYKTLVKYDFPPMRNIDQVLTYHSTILKTNFAINIKVNFVKMVKCFVSVLVIKRRPENSEKKDYQKLSRLIQRAILMNDYEGLGGINLEFAKRIIHRLQLPLAENGVAYDVASRPEVYLQPYLKLNELYEEFGLPLFNVVPLSNPQACHPGYYIISQNNLEGTCSKKFIG